MFLIIRLGKQKLNIYRMFSKLVERGKRVQPPEPSDGVAKVIGLRGRHQEVQHTGEHLFYLFLLQKICFKNKPFQTIFLKFIRRILPVEDGPAVE